ncbi:MAG: TonB C-terminal domain-containing protein [Verrucomicrobia bacterium]|nr:TonB C-terminal domain-containing protein [Verrucomicrobiota bacterium]
MTSGLPRHFKVVATVHFSLVAVLVVIHFAQRFLHRHEKHEMITYVNLSGDPVPPPTVVPVEEVKPPEPPPPPPKEIPQPPKKKIEKSKKRVKKEPEKQTRERPLPDLEKILRDTVEATQKFKESQEAIPAWYFKLVRKTMYDAWRQPSSLASSQGLKAVISIRVNRDGSISRRELVGSSGNVTMDDSVVEAVYSVKKLKPLPNEFRGKYKDITIEFEVTH